MSSHSTEHRDNKTDDTKDSTRRDENATAHVNPSNAGETDTSASPLPQTEKKMTTAQAIPQMKALRRKIDTEKAQRATNRLRELAAKYSGNEAWQSMTPEEIKKELGTRNV